MPAVFRNPVASAMEIATLARLHPGRFIAGLGHGVPSWMAQIGALPARPVRALEEVTLTVRHLLAGERVTVAGDHVHVTGAQLLQPPAEIPPVVLGVRRPAGLRAAGRSADGTILCEPASPEYIAWARRRIDEGRAEAGRTDPHRIIVFVKCRIDSDRSAARSWVAEILQNVAVEAQLAPLGLGEELDELRALGDPAALPDELVDRLTASGTPDEVAAALAAIEAAAVDSIVLVPIGPNPDEQLRLVADTLVRA
jgi:alkanesulfonate monooxygenase SsuD/methylene tetrahydromethanopterin reductase-like flavin-dependent oxidoreductase (luciferase family)